MREIEHILSVVAEEAAEVTQRATKCQRFGVSEVQPGQLRDNTERLMDEFYDLVGALEMLQERGILKLALESPYARAKIDAKKAKVLHFMEYARSIGELE